MISISANFHKVVGFEPDDPDARYYVDILLGNGKDGWYLSLDTNKVGEVTNEVLARGLRALADKVGQHGQDTTAQQTRADEKGSGEEDELTG